MEKFVPYLFIYLVLASLSLTTLTGKDAKKYQNPFLIFSGLLLATFAGIRSNSVDPDYKVYNEVFNIIDKGYELNSNMEVGFVFYNKMISTFSSDFSLFLIVYSISSIFFIIKSVRRFSPFPILSLLLYFVHAYLGRDMIAIRSAFSYAIIMYAVLEYINSNSWKKLLVYVFSASLFHVTALFSLLVIPILFTYNKLGIRKFTFILIIFTFLLLFLANDYVIFSVFSVILGEKSIVYQTYFLSSTKIFDLGLLNPVNIKNILLCVCLYVYCRGSINNERLFAVFSSYSAALIAFHEFGVVIARSAAQIITLDIIIIPIIISFLNVRERFIAFFGVLLYAMLMLIINLSREGAYNYSQVLM